MPSKTPYLFRSRHGIYYFRLVVPEGLRQVLGRTEVRRSLKTRSKREALIGAARLLLDAKELLGKESGQVTGKEAVMPVQKDAPKFSDVLKARSKAQKLRGVSLKTIEDNTYQAELLIYILSDKPINKYTLNDAKAFRDKALQLPPRTTKLLKKNPDKTVSELISEADSTISISTYNHYVRNLSSVFEFAITEGYVMHNPFKKMFITRKIKKSSLRDTLTPDEIKLIFKATEKSRKAYQYWLPRIALYSGCRLNEICQLYVEDIQTVDSIPCIHVQATRTDQRIKSPSSERLIPIHSKLICLGFLEYIDSLKRSGRLFPELNYSDRAGYSSMPSRWFLDLRKKVNLTEEGKSFHSFRHTVADILKGKDYSEALVSGLLGHSNSSITYNRYGKDYKPRILLPVVEAIDIL